jgi:superfamily II DNA or RNA helicase
MLAVHALWSPAGRELLLWAEDSSLAGGPLAPARQRGRRPRGGPREHPFAAPAEKFVEVLAGAGARNVPRLTASTTSGASSTTSGASAPPAAPVPPTGSASLTAPVPPAGSASLTGATSSVAAVWLPAVSGVPETSPHLVLDAEHVIVSPGSGHSELLPFTVPVLGVGASEALDLLLVLAYGETPGIAPGASVTVLASLAGLALEVVAGGRVLPALVAGDRGVFVARWSPVGGGHDEERLRLIAAALPPLCRAFVPGSLRRQQAGGRRQPSLSGTRPSAGDEPAGTDPLELAKDAFEALVDAACRDALCRTRRSLLGLAGRAGQRRPAAEAWLQALASKEAEVAGDAGELAKLERLVAEWRASAAGRGGPWRLCFRLREPQVPEGAEAPADKGTGPGVAGVAGFTGTADAADVAGGAGVGPARATAAADAAGGAGVAGTAGATGVAGVEPLGGSPSTTWRVELLLQATDDPSLLVEAREVWRAGKALRRAARTVESPQEVLLAELGRARTAFPELSMALREAAPTRVELDLAGAHRFLSLVAPTLEVAGFGVLLPSWWRRPSARLGARLRARSKSPGTSSGLLSGGRAYEFDWKAAIGDEELTLRELEALARLKAPLVRVRGQWVELRPGEAEKLAEFIRSGRRTGAGQMTVAGVLRAGAGLDLAVGEVPVLGVEADGLLGALLRGELEDRLEVKGTPPGFAGELRPYQQRGVAWIELLERTGLGACLADDMGLGKTATVLALVQAERETTGRHKKSAGTTLVVCPTSVVGNWKREAEKFVPQLKVWVHHGTGRARAEDFSKKAKSVDIVVTSYSLLDRDSDALGSLQWRRVVLDEAQNVKNPEARQTKAARALPADRKVALTGTPVENNLGELWSIMEILNPGLLGSASAFREQFALPIERYHHEEAAEQLRALTRPLVLRRLKTDKSIISDLPEKLEMKVFCNLTREQATLYKAVVDEMLRRIDNSEGIERRGLVLATMLRLKQVCNHPAHYLGDLAAGASLAQRSGKLERTVEILDEVLQGGERALVFSQFAEMGAMLRSHLQERLGCQVGFLHGGLPRHQRDALVERFQSGEGVPIMVLSLKAGGTGLNLTAANHVVHFDRWWNPAVENQATDRAFRIGQRRRTQVRKLVCAGTLEERIDQMIESKRALAERIVGSGEAWLTELSTAELAEVFRLSSEALGAAA